MNEAAALKTLAAEVAKAGSQDKFGAIHGITGSMVGMVLRRERALSKPLLDAIGLECIERKIYRRKVKGRCGEGNAETG